MRNVFHQYDQPENKLTHALACVLYEDRHLIRPFLSWLGIKGAPPVKDLRVVEQQVPGLLESGDEDEARGLPDICIYSDDGWCAAVESKLQSGLKVDQLRRHQRTAQRYGFDDPHLVVLAVDKTSDAVRDLAHVREWREVYAWFRTKRAKSPWSQKLTDYMEAYESHMLAKGYGIRGTITMFDGLRFDEDNPYSYREGKRLIRLLGDELRGRKDLHSLGVDPKGKGRGAITGKRRDSVWDFLSFKAARGSSNFTAHPHLTMSISRTYAVAAVTVPNGIKGGFKTKLRDEGFDAFNSMLIDIENNLRGVTKQSKGASPFVYALQRHYLHQRSDATTDARLDADLRTLSKTKSRVKYQPQWGEAIYNALMEKKSNIQLGVEMRFFYGCPVLGSPKAPDLFADSWKAMKPLLDFVRT